MYRNIAVWQEESVQQTLALEACIKRHLTERSSLKGKCRAITILSPLHRFPSVLIKVCILLSTSGCHRYGYEAINKLKQTELKKKDPNVNI